MSAPANEITVREALIDDLPQITKLFKETIQRVNRKDYSPGQIEIWSSAYNEIERWKMRLKDQYFIIAQISGKIVGFSSLSPTGYLDLMYVHKDHQGEGIATILLESLLKKAKDDHLIRLESEVSITALPFFRRRGFDIVKKQEKLLKNTHFVNYLMKIDL